MFTDTVLTMSTLTSTSLYFNNKSHYRIKNWIFILLIIIMVYLEGRQDYL